MKIKFKNNSEITTLPSDEETVRGHRAELPLFEPAARLSSEEINEILFKREFDCSWIPSNCVTISFKNNGMYDERAINRPILRKKEQSWDKKVIGVITEVNEELVTGVIYADAVPEINNGYVCSVELKER